MNAEVKSVMKNKNKQEKFYRLVINNIGIYEAVERDCPKDDVRRKNKPDGSWLKRKGLEYPGAISFWKENGLKQYIESGLLHWHASVVNGNVEVLIIDKPKEIIYEDENQILCKPEMAHEAERLYLKEFLARIQ